MLGHATFHTYELAIPLFVAVWLDSFGTTPAVLGVVVGLGYAAIGLGALPTGILADRVSARSLVIVCLVGMGASVALLSLAPSLPILAIALLGWGVSASLYHPAGLTLISRATRERGTAFALHGAAGNVGVATGPLLAAVLLGLFDWRFVAAVLVVPAVVAAGLALRLEFDERAGARVREDEPVGDGGEGRSLRGFLGQSKLLFTGGFALVFTVGVLYGTYYRGAITFLPDILADLALFEPVAAYGTTVEPSQYVYAGLLLLGGVGQYAGGRLVDAVPVEWALVAGYASLVVIAVAFIPLTAAGLVPLLVGAAVLGFSVFMIAPINQEAISAYTTADVRGLSFGYNYAAIFGIGAVGATLAGLVLTRWSPAVLFLVLAGIALVGMAVSALLLRPSIGRARGIAD
jgi:MFS family permease